LIKLNISGIIDDDEEYLFVNYLWPITFMMKNLFKGQDEISIDAASFAYDGEDIASDIEFLNEKYPDYSFSNPFIEYKDNINQTIKYVEIGLNIFSFFSLATSLMMVIMASYLFVVDFKKEIGIYTYLGYSKKSIKKQFKMISFYLSFYAGILSCISLIFIIYLTKYLNLGFEIVLDSSIKTPFLVILGISFIIGVISSYFSCFKTFKISPLKQLQDF
jgi:ABC-type antimicrobial peptide transport system permease subunit